MAVSGAELTHLTNRYVISDISYVPIFVDIMRESLKDFQSRPFKIPSGLKFVKIDRNTGKAPLPSTLKKDIIFEIFKEENYEKYIKNNSNLNNGEINYENVIY